MYTLNIKVKTATDRMEEEHHFVTIPECYGKIIEVCTAKEADPGDEFLTFTISPLRGSLPIDAKI